jgi:hypothetical protein
MADEKKHDCGCKNEGECNCEGSEYEIVELEDEKGQTEEYVIIDKVDFENRHFVIIAPLAQCKALDNSEDDTSIDLDAELFEVVDDNFTLLEDENLAKRLQMHWDKMILDMAKEQ